MMRQAEINILYNERAKFLIDLNTRMKLVYINLRVITIVIMDRS